jgi:ubiquinone/menaquinone biosynthesis C-methylase UbiE/DNA-binding transcriptional ArsR family regulator
MKEVLEILRACAEPSRLRIVSLCSQSELAVGDIAIILGMSQPRVSKHLRVLNEASLLTKYTEGNFAFYRASESDPARRIRELILGEIANSDEQLERDQERLQDLRAQQAAAAEAHFDRIASEWDKLRQLYGGDSSVEDALISLVQTLKPKVLLDVGTGTGRILEVVGPLVDECVGVDRSREMLQIARTRLDVAGLKNCLVRFGDMYHLPFTDNHVDLVILHLVLHYAHEPQRVIREAARVLRHGGSLVVVDFESHAEEWLREEMNHARLGFQPEEMKEIFIRNHLAPQKTVRFPAHKLTMRLWRAKK